MLRRLKPGNSLLPKILSALFLVLASGVGWSELSANAPRPASDNAGTRAAEFELKDQYDTVRTYRFPKTRITVLTFGDRKGSEQIEGWVRPLYNRYQERVEQYGVAVLNAVPSLMRGIVRSMFKSKVKYPVLLDWKGDVARSYQYESRQANVVVVDRAGHIIYRTKGAATEPELQKLYAQLDRLLAEGK